MPFPVLTLTRTLYLDVPVSSSRCKGLYRRIWMRLKPEESCVALRLHSCEQLPQQVAERPHIRRCAVGQAVEHLLLQIEKSGATDNGKWRCSGGGGETGWDQRLDKCFRQPFTKLTGLRKPGV